jgi:uncharacterized protein YkwD
MIRKNTPPRRGVLLYNVMYMASRKRQRPLPPLLPRRKRERRRIELLGMAAMSGFALLIAAVFFVSSLQQTLLRSPQVAAVVSAVLVDLANGDRTQNGVALLTVNPLLVAAAQAKANDMATYGYFAHVSPTGVNPWYWFKQAGYNFSYAGENLAVDFSDSGDVNSAWMNSPAHRANLLNPEFTEVGIATAQGMYQGQPTTFVVQEFGTPASAGVAQAPVKTAIVPTTATQPALATTESTSARVLGTESQSAAAPAAAKKPAAPAPVTAIATTAPAVAASLTKEAAANPPFWAPLVAFPKDTLRYAYYFIGVLILLSLVVETGFEIRWHHRAHALKAGALLASMGILFVLANLLFFAEPVLAATAALFGH